MDIATTYEFQVPTGPSSTPESIVRQAYATTREFFGDVFFTLEVTARGRPGHFEVWARATREISMNGSDQ